MQAHVVNLTGKEVQVRRVSGNMYCPSERRAIFLPQVRTLHVQGDSLATIGREPSVALMTQRVVVEGLPRIDEADEPTLYLVTPEIAQLVKRDDVICPDGNVAEEKTYIVCDGFARFSA